MVITKAYVVMYSLAMIMLFVGTQILVSAERGIVLVLPVIMVYLAGGLTEHARLIRLEEIT